MRPTVLRRPSSTLARARRAVSQRRTEKDEVGASLILALIFLTVISVTVASLLGLIGGGLTDSIHFKDARTTESAANSTAELALQNVRYNFMANTVNSPNPVTCTSSLPSILNLPPMQAFCRTAWNSTSGSRNVIVSVCASGVDSLTCENQPLLQAVVYFNDNSVSSKNTCTPVTSPTTGTTCGSGLSVVSWVVDATPPTVTGVAIPGPTSPTITCSQTGAQPLVIQGSGFLYTNGFLPQVTFDDPANYTSQTATAVQVLNNSTILACSPVGTGANVNFPVTVTTPSGTSAYNSGSNNGFTY
jgi:hypothetical protein